MNTIVTSKEKILEKSRELIREQGWAAVNIRSVAAVCGVSVGSIYHYFDSKAELVGAAVESVWHEIFQDSWGEYERPSLKWILSEMVVESIMKDSYAYCQAHEKEIRAHIQEAESRGLCP